MLGLGHWLTCLLKSTANVCGPFRGDAAYFDKVP